MKKSISCLLNQSSLDQRALIVGILNVTPDSFSDGGAFFDPEKACSHGLKMLAEGADILDIGGASSRPGADILFTTNTSAPSAISIDAEEELRRIMPVIHALRKKTNAPLSIDTCKASVAETALAAGADIINDITALHGDERMGDVVAEAKAGLMLMHMQGTPETMQKTPTYPNDDVVGAVVQFLTEAREKALSYGIDPTSIILDPGIGFGKTFPHNLALLRALPHLVRLGAPVMIGHSRKAFLSCINELPSKITDRIVPGLAITSLARQAGAMLFRVHEPRPHWEAVRMVERFLKQ